MDILQFPTAGHDQPEDLSIARLVADGVAELPAATH